MIAAEGVGVVVNAGCGPAGGAMDGAATVGTPLGADRVGVAAEAGTGDAVAAASGATGAGDAELDGALTPDDPALGLGEGAGMG